MPILTEDQLVKQKAGSAETSKRYNPPGVYLLRRFDEETEEWLPDVKIIVKDHPKFGSAQADALVRLGFRWKREATTEELRPIGFLPEPAKPGTVLAAQSGDVVPKSDFEAVLARLNALESAQKQPEKPLRLWNKTDLTAKAVSLGISIPEDATNATIVELIEAEQSGNPLV